MTHLDIDKLEAGPKMDQLIAVLVMGWQRWNTWIDQAQTIPVVKFIVQGSLGSRSAPLFSTDIAAAWLVIRKIKEVPGVTWHIHSTVPPFSPWSVDVVDQSGPFVRRYTGEADTFPLAICRAALKAVMGQDA